MRQVWQIAAAQHKLLWRIIPLAQPRRRRRCLSEPQLAPMAHRERGFQLSWHVAQPPLTPLEAVNKGYYYGLDPRLVALKPVRVLRARGRAAARTLLSSPLEHHRPTLLVRQFFSPLVGGVLGVEGVSWGGRGSNHLGF